jgi:hypothetical protein
MDAEMRDYFAAIRIEKLLEACERHGINTWQSRADRHIMRLLNEYRLEGSSIHVDRADRPGVRRLAAEPGRIEVVREALKAIRQTGAQIGLGTRMPEVVDHAESNGWELDSYMISVYNLGRTREEASHVAGRTVTGEYFRDDDRQEMLARVKRTAKTCLIFKIYGATRQCGSAKGARLRSAARRSIPEGDDRGCRGAGCRTGVPCGCGNCSRAS